MQPQQLERIRMLENRMRRPSKPLINQQSLKTIKSTDSKKIIMPVQQNKKKQEAEQEWEADRIQHIKLSQEQIKVNRKITDFFKIVKRDPKNSSEKEEPASPKHNSLIQQVEQPMSRQICRSPPSPTRSKSAGEDTARDEIRGLKQTLKQKDQMLLSLKTQVVENTVRIHRSRRNQLRQKVNYNKWRLGQFTSLKGGNEHWMDGVEIKDCKEKLEGLKKEKELLEKSKRQARRGKDQEEADQWKITFASQTYFLSRQELHYEDQLKKLEEEKANHVKEYRLLYEQDSSRYGKQVTLSTQNWPLIKRYQLLGLLGRGGFSQVYKGFDVEQLKEVAVKVHEFNPKWNNQAKQNYIKHAVRQNAVHKMLSHPNIVRSYDTVEIDSNSFCTVLEYCEGPDLSHYLKKHKKIPERQAKLIIRQVASAIRYLHELPDKVIHYDLKPQNILFHKGRVKITDFGLCKTTKEDAIELTSQGVGTYWYLPPECFSEEKAVITPKVDVWSIGVIYFEMLYGEKPFGNAMSQLRILKEGIMLKAHSVSFPNAQKNTISQESKEFIKECLEFKAESRLTTRGVTEHRLFRPK